MDPVGAGYVYAGDDPVNVVDPSGRLNFIPIPGGLIINLTPQDIYNFQVNSGYIAAFLGFLSLTLPSLAPYAAAAGVVLAASVEIGLYSTAFCGGGSVNVTILYADLNGWTQSCA